ncbi:MAG: response regulator [Pseudomonadota bacterium]
MSLSQQLAGDLPFLRRYARALSGSQAKGDAMVRATLETALAKPALLQSLGDGRAALYKVFHVTLNNGEFAKEQSAIANPKEASALRKLDAITDRKRQALLLTTVEEFTPQQAGDILQIAPSEVEVLVRDAIAQIDAEQKTRVLIIEDEPMILMQLEDLVVSLDHTVCGTATTHAEAISAFGKDKPGLVLADIQLADGSSGLDAVEDILGQSTVPVIFITAYPEQLLTGDRLEPTYLVTKPFREQTVRAAISQALFFG